MNNNIDNNSGNTQNHDLYNNSQINNQQLNNSINTNANYNVNAKSQNTYVNSIQNPNSNNIGAINNTNNPQEYTTNSNSINASEPNNSNKIIIIVIIVVIALLIILGLTKVLGGNSKTGNSYEVGVGEVLEINEPATKFYIKVLSSPEKYTITDDFLTRGDYFRVKVAVENPTTSELKFTILDNFYLLDSTKNTIATSNGFVTDDDSIFGKNIASGDYSEGYIYFYSTSDEDRGYYTTDYSKINDIEYLKITIISKIESDGDGQYNRYNEDYYIKLK